MNHQRGTNRDVFRCRWSQLVQWARDKKQTKVRRASSMSSSFHLRRTMLFSNQLRFLFVLSLTALQPTTGKLSDNETHVPSNESLGVNTTSVSSSPLITALSSRKPSVSSRVQKKLTSSPTAMTPFILASYLVEQFNHYRDVEILARIKHCDSNMKLNEMCETYSFDNHTYELIRQSSVDFQSFQYIFDALVDRLIVQKLSQFCSPGHWCLANLTNNDIRFTVDVLRQRGQSLCALEKYHDRLAVHINACPSILARNFSTSTLKLLPMFCELYQEQQYWNSRECVHQVVYLLHLLYAFWPQLETCHRVISAGTGGCSAECLAFDTLLHQVNTHCHPNASFLSRVPTMAWYRLISLEQLCRHETIVPHSPFISSVKNFIESNVTWDRFHQRPVYAVLSIITLICIVVSFSLCLYLMSRTQSDSETRRVDDDYEYTRLQDASFDLGSGTEIPNTTPMINQTHFDRNGNRRSAEQQRLLYLES